MTSIIQDDQFYPVVFEIQISQIVMKTFKPINFSSILQHSRDIDVQKFFPFLNIFKNREFRLIHSQKIVEFLFVLLKMMKN